MVLIRTFFRRMTEGKLYLITQKYERNSIWAFIVTLILHIPNPVTPALIFLLYSVYAKNVSPPLSLFTVFLANGSLFSCFIHLSSTFQYLSLGISATFTSFQQSFLFFLIKSCEFFPIPSPFSFPFCLPTTLILYFLCSNWYCSLCL